MASFSCFKGKRAWFTHRAAGCPGPSGLCHSVAGHLLAGALPAQSLTRPKAGGVSLSTGVVSTTWIRSPGHVPNGLMEPRNFPRPPWEHQCCRSHLLTPLTLDFGDDACMSSRRTSRIQTKQKCPAPAGNANRPPQGSRGAGWASDRVPWPCSQTSDLLPAGTKAKAPPDTDSALQFCLSQKHPQNPALLQILTF